MKLLLDENLSYRVLKGILDLYPESLHIARVQLQQADDRDIWDYAKANGLTIVSKDDDFQRLSILRGHPPKVVWIDVTNCPTGHIIHLLRAHRDELRRFAEDDAVSLLIIR